TLARAEYDGCTNFTCSPITVARYCGSTNGGTNTGVWYDSDTCVNCDSGRCVVTSGGSCNIQRGTLINGYSIVGLTSIEPCDCPNPAVSGVYFAQAPTGTYSTSDPLSTQPTKYTCGTGG